MAEEGAEDADYEELRSMAISIGLTSLEVKRTIKSARG